MTDTAKLDLRSMSITDDQKAKLKQLFPEVFNEDKVDFDKLKRTLGEEIDTDEERFGMTWPGKNDCFKVIQTPSIGTLKPAKNESVNWDDTENLFIEGDNLEVLKLLQGAYYGKVKMIYIDPPYNTGKEFIYPDNFTESLETYLTYTGQKDQEGRKFTTNTETSGRFHSKWLNMMYPRLFLAKNLLRDDGLFVVHIDEHEVHNLKSMMNELVGEENFVGEIIWDKKNPKGDAKGIAYQHESILVYAKNATLLYEKHNIQRPKKNAVKIIKKADDLFQQLNSGKADFSEINSTFSKWIRSNNDLSGGEAAYNQIDENGDVYRLVSMAWPNKKKAPDDYFIPLIHPVTKKPCPVPQRGWRNPPDTMKKLLEMGQIIFGKDESTQPQRKYLLKENMYENIPSILPFGSSDDAFFKAIGLSFDNPKPYKFVSQLILSFSGDEDIILDFFAGSSTVAHGTIVANQTDKNNRSYIMIQLPELCEESSEEYTSGYKTIADIGKERIRRVIKKINEEQVSKDKQTVEKLSGMEDEKAGLDLGFRVFKLDKSNFDLWDGTVDESGDISGQIEMFIDHIDPDADDEGILYEILLKTRFPLTTQTEELKFSGQKVYSVANKALLICLDRKLTKEVITQMARLQPARVICLDTGFTDNDQLKTNAVQIMKSFNVSEFCTI